jgi:hypothetical protein
MNLRVCAALWVAPPSQAMFNVAKVAKSHILRYFNDIFNGICRLVADMDPEVRTDADAMNRKMKDIVTGIEGRECTTAARARSLL